MSNSATRKQGVYHRSCATHSPNHVLDVTVNLLTNPLAPELPQLSIRVILDAAPARLTIDELDQWIDVLKSARRAARDALWKASQGLTASQRQRAAQTDPEWAKRMMANPPEPVNLTSVMNVGAGAAAERATDEYRLILHHNGVVTGLERKFVNMRGGIRWEEVEGRRLSYPPEPGRRWPVAGEFDGGPND